MKQSSGMNCSLHAGEHQLQILQSRYFLSLFQKMVNGCEKYFLGQSSLELTCFWMFLLNLSFLTTPPQTPSSLKNQFLQSQLYRRKQNMSLDSRPHWARSQLMNSCPSVAYCYRNGTSLFPVCFQAIRYLCFRIFSSS